MKRQQLVLGIVGWSGCGKTTLIEAILPLLQNKGFCISVVKHSHHQIEHDTPGKDSWRHSRAGASQVMLISDGKSSITTNHAKAPDLDEQLRLLQPVDLVIFEGQKWLDIPKIEVFRQSIGKPMLHLECSGIFLQARDSLAEANLGVPSIQLDNIHGIADCIADWIRENR